MADRPILFSGPMVRALLAGTKTQTRRTLKGSALAAHEPQWEAKKGADGVWRIEADTPEVSGRIVPDIRIAVGDRLWVRETFSIFADDFGWDDYEQRQCSLPDQTIVYEADRGAGPVAASGYRPPTNAKREVIGVAGADDTWTEIGSIPAIFMPRWASRLTLTVTDVRVERLQDISEADALAEGFPHRWALKWRGKPGAPLLELNPTRWYADLWNDINGKGSWQANPWVAAYTFTVERGNIDALPNLTTIGDSHE